jgi:hypothetical protein
VGSKIIVQTKKARVKTETPPVPGDEYGDQLTNSMLCKRRRAVEEVAAKNRAKIDPSKFAVGGKVTQITEGGKSTRLSATVTNVNREEQILSCDMDYEPRSIKINFSAVTDYADPNAVRTSSPTT